ncbi:MAG: exonuclease domain-containing protein, partial [Thermodesulfobacteriota bacterium]
APSFAVVWPKIKKYILNQTVVVHNGAFDFSCLSQTLDYYGLAQPKYKPQCTYEIFGKKLDLLCKKHKIQLNHHDALSDAMACARLYQLHLGLR